MFKNDSRVERKNGILFYEQDILYSDYSFTHDLKIEIKADYLSSGIGVVLLDESSYPLNNIYIFKIGYLDFTVINKRGVYQKTMMHTSNNVQAPISDLEISFSKTGREIEMRKGDNLLGHYILPEDIDKYKIGFYSNQGNTLKTISIASGAPKSWMINIKNTNGGRVFFYKDGFKFENCEKDAEIEQSKIFLPKGRYHLAYNEKEINNMNDIRSFIFYSDDNRFDDNEKNMLNNKVLELAEDSFVNLKFKGTQGAIENIIIKTNINQDYVSTDRVAVTTSGSEIIIDLEDLESVRWRGIVNSVPIYENITDVRDYGIIATKSKKYLLEEMVINLKEEYSYYLEVATMTLNIYKGEELLSSEVIELTAEDNNKISVFKNVNAIIDQLIVRYTNGEERDILLQKTTKVYIPEAIKGPIMVTDVDHIPLDLSASYRFSEDDNGNIIYTFTNWARESFNPIREVILSKKIINASGNIRVYGVTQESLTEDKNFYKIRNIDEINEYASDYEIIEESGFKMDYSLSKVSFEEQVLSKNYKEIVIDYLKNDSYCINHYEPSYEVDICTDRDTVSVVYDFLLDDQDYQGVITEYEITDIGTDRNKYIVLRKN